MSDIAEFYDNYTQRQSKAGINHRHLSIQRLLEKYGLRKNHKVLEIGCGIGTQTFLISKYLNKSGFITALDLSTKSIEIARSTVGKKCNNLKFIAADINETEFKEQFDSIVLPDVLEHIPLETHNQLFKKLDKVLKPEGSIYIHIPDPRYLDWFRKNHPEELQVIDQSLYTDLISGNLNETQFYIHYLKTYSVYFKPYDYQFIILRKFHNQKFIENPTPPTDSLFRRIKRKLNIS